MFVQTQRSVSSDSIESIKSPPVDQPTCIGSIIDSVSLQREAALDVEEKPAPFVVISKSDVPSPAACEYIKPSERPKSTFVRRLSQSLHDIELKTAAILHRRPSTSRSSLSSVSSDDKEKVHEFVKHDHPREAKEALESLTHAHLLKHPAQADSDADKIHEFVPHWHPREPKEALEGLTHAHLLKHPHVEQPDADKIHEFVKHQKPKEAKEALEALTHSHLLKHPQQSKQPDSWVYSAEINGYVKQYEYEPRLSNALDGDKIHEFVHHDHPREPKDALQGLTRAHLLKPELHLPHDAPMPDNLEKMYLSLALIDEHSVPRPVEQHELKDALKLAVRSPRTGLTRVDRVNKAREEAVWTAGHHTARDAMLGLAC